MDKDQAERALAIIRGVIDNTRDDLIARNWGVIWMTHSFINSSQRRMKSSATIERHDLLGLIHESRAAA